MMLTIFTVLTLLAIALGAGTICLAGASRSPGTDTVQTATQSTDTTAGLRKQLQELARSDPPKELSMGAMCYEMAMPPVRIDYTCPVCTNKTLYAASEENGWNESTRFLSWELDACRRLVKEIKGLDIHLDESLFCKHCKPDADARKLALVIFYPEGKTHRVDDVSLEDLTLLKEFTSGSKTHSGAQGRETPLKDHLPRLEQLLGVSLEKN